MPHAQKEFNQEIDINVEKLLNAVRSGDTELVRVLLKKPNIDVNGVTKYWVEFTPLCLAAYRGYDAVVKILLTRPNTDVNKSTYLGDTPLCLAAMNGHIEVVKMLLTRPDIDVNKNNVYGHTPLFGAVKGGNSDIVKMLLALPDIDVDKGNNGGWTPLYIAARVRNDEIAKALIKKGASRINDKSGITDPTILNMLAAQEYIDDIMSNKIIGPRELTEELAQMVLARAEIRLKSLFDSNDVIFDISRFEEILLNQKDTHPILDTILKLIHNVMENTLSSDMEIANEHYKLSICANFGQLKNMGRLEGKDNHLFQQLFNTYKNSKEDTEVIAGLKSLKEDFAYYLGQKKFCLVENASKVPEQFVDQVKSLFARLVEIKKMGGSGDYGALNPEEQEALLFYSLNPQYQIPGILTQEAASGDFGLDINTAIAILEAEPSLSGDSGQDQYCIIC
jgi:hypothetical protein